MDKKSLVAAMQKTAADAAVGRPVEVKGWGTVIVHDLTVEEVDAQATEDDGKDNKRRLARAAARVMFDKDGNRYFNPENAEEVTLIAKQPWRLLRKIVAMGQGDEEEVPKGN